HRKSKQFSRQPSTAVPCAPGLFRAQEWAETPWPGFALAESRHGAKHPAGFTCFRGPPAPAPLFPVTPIAALIDAYRTQKIDAAEGRPQHVAEVEFAVGRLPQQKTGKALLAAGADDEIRIRHAFGVQVMADVTRLEV